MEKLLATVRIVVKETPPYLQLKHFFKVNKTFISYTLILIPQQLYFPSSALGSCQAFKGFLGNSFVFKVYKKKYGFFFISQSKCKLQTILSVSSSDNGNEMLFKLLQRRKDISKQNI